MSLDQILSEQEQNIFRSHEELSQLNAQDFLALKARLVVLEYYDVTNPARDFAASYDNFKADVIRGWDPEYNLGGVDSRNSQEHHVGTHAYIYDNAGVDLRNADAKTFTDIARVAVSDPGYDHEFGRQIENTIRNLGQNEDIPFAERTALYQGILRTYGMKGEDGNFIEITGTLDRHTIAAEQQFSELTGAFFTTAERIGWSGWENADANLDGEADANYETFDDQALFDELDSTDYDHAKLGDLTGINQTQIMMMQGLINVVADKDLAIDGIEGPLTRAAVKEFFEQHNLPLADTVEDGLNSHHFELLRNWAVKGASSSEELGNYETIRGKLRDLIEQEQEAGRLNGLTNYEYNDTVAAAQATLNILGHITTIDGLYGGQTAKNIMLEHEKGNSRDPDADYEREPSLPLSTSTPGGS